MSSITTAQILAALAHVEEPDLKKDLVTLGMVKDVVVAGDMVSFTVVLTTPACPLKEAIRMACVNAVQLLVAPHLQVMVNFTARVSSTLPNGTGIAGVRQVIAIASGKGGVGKSTLAANLAIALQQAGARVGLLDADLYGPSQAIMFGVQDERPLVSEHQGQEKMHPILAHGVQLMSLGFLLRPGEPVVWRGPMAANQFKQLAFTTLWDEVDYLIIDLPPGTGDIQLSLAQQVPLSGVVIVTTPQAVAVADARRAAHMLRVPALNVPILGVVENMAYFSPPELPANRYYLFGKGGGEALAAELGVPLLGQVPLVESVGSAGDDGLPSTLDMNSPVGAAFRSIASLLAQQLAIAAAMPKLIAEKV